MYYIIVILSVIHLFVFICYTSDFRRCGMYICICMYVCVYVYTYTHTHIHTHTYTHTHTHTHIYIHTSHTYISLSARCTIKIPISFIRFYWLLME